MEKLKPCPFCGGKAVLKQIPIGQDFPYYVQCDNMKCLINSSTCCRATPEEAIEIWNHRPGEADAYLRGLQKLPYRRRPMP